jgi:DNA-binding LytR/AlgR family response regulator
MSQIITFLLTSIESSLISEIPKFSRQRKLLFVLGLIPLNLFFRNKKEILPEFINTAIENKSLGEFYALQQQGHYINIITSSKDELVLMKMKRANDLLKHSFGTQVHRSYWIRFMAIKEVVTKNSKTTIVLQNNTEIAVSKTYKIDFEKKYKIYQEKQARKEEV